MTFKKVLIAGLAATGLIFNSGWVMAQDAGASNDTQAAAAGGDETQAAPERKPEDNWLKVCDPIDNGKKACIMRQVVIKNGQFIGSFLLRDDPGQESRLLAVAAVPLGVLLPFGLTWQIDNGKPIRVPYMLCDPQSCATQLVVNEAYVNSLKKGAVLKLTAKNRQNKDLVVNVNLSGFTSVYDSDTALTFDQYRKETTGANALEQVLQDKAEKIRQEKASEGAASGDASGDAGNSDSSPQ